MLEIQPLSISGSCRWLPERYSVVTTSWGKSASKISEAQSYDERFVSTAHEALECGAAHPMEMCSR